MAQLVTVSEFLLEYKVVMKSFLEYMLSENNSSLVDSLVVASCWVLARTGYLAIIVTGYQLLLGIPVIRALI